MFKHQKECSKSYFAVLTDKAGKACRHDPCSDSFPAMTGLAKFHRAKEAKIFMAATVLFVFRCQN